MRRDLSAETNMSLATTLETRPIVAYVYVHVK